MTGAKPLRVWMEECRIDAGALAERTGLEKRVVLAIAAGQYTTSPQQRARLANAVGADPAAVDWGQAVEVDPMYGHGPQFGRSP